MAIGYQELCQACRTQYETAKEIADCTLLAGLPDGKQSTGSDVLLTVQDVTENCAATFAEMLKKGCSANCLALALERAGKLLVGSMIPQGEIAATLGEYGLDRNTPLLKALLLKIPVAYESVPAEAL